MTFRKYTSLVYNGMKFSGTSKSFTYAAKPLYDLQQSTAPGSAYAHPLDMKPHPLLIHYFLVHRLHHNLDDATHHHIFAAVSWLKHCHAKYHFGKPLEIWWKDEYENFDMYVPIQLLTCHLFFCSIGHEEQSVYLMCPVHDIATV